MHFDVKCYNNLISILRLFKFNHFFPILLGATKKLLALSCGRRQSRRGHMVFRADSADYYRHTMAAGGEFVEGWLVAQVLGEGAYGE